MKHLRNVLALVLAAVMAVVLGVTPALAAAATSGTITIQSTETGTVYDLYKIFDLTGVDSDYTEGTTEKYDAVAYTIDSDWTAFFGTGGAGASYIVAANNADNSLNPINVDGTIKYINITEDNIVEFTNKAMAYAVDTLTSAKRDATVTGDGSDKVVDSLGFGYYLIVPVGASTQNGNSSGSVASIDSTVPTATVKVKAEKPKITKTDDAITVDVGQTVSYTIDGTVPNTTGYTSYTYTVADTMTSGLTYNSSSLKVVLKKDSTTITLVDGGAVASGVTGVSIINKDGTYTKTPTTKGGTGETVTVGNGFALQLGEYLMSEAGQAYKGYAIEITYNATVNDDAVTHNQEKNSATLEYSNNPTDETAEETEEIEEEVYTAKVTINKYTGDSATASTGKLGGAQFALMKMDGTTAKYYKYTAASGTTPAKVEWVEVSGAPANGTDNVTDSQAKALADATTITTKTTTSDGAAEFPGIADGTYYLVEIAAPTGYNRLAAPQSVTVTGTDVDNTTHLENTAYAGQTEFDSANSPTANVQNNTGSELPSTGGMGTRILYTVGGIMLVGGAIALVSRKRVANMEK